MTSTSDADAISALSNDFSVADDAIVTLQIQLPNAHYRKFRVHESLLCRVSPVFRTALQGQFGEAISRTIDVKDTLFTTIDDFVFWLYRGKCRQPRDPTGVSFLRYARLNSFAEKYDIAILQYDAAVTMVERVPKVYNNFWPDGCPLLDEIYPNTRPGDYFRTLIVAIYVYRVKPKHFKTVNSAQYLEKYPDFAIEVASAMGRRIAGPDSINFDASVFLKSGSTSVSTQNARPTAGPETQSDVTREQINRESQAVIPEAAATSST